MTWLLHLIFLFLNSAVLLVISLMQLLLPGCSRVLPLRCAQRLNKLAYIGASWVVNKATQLRLRALAHTNTAGPSI